MFINLGKMRFYYRYHMQKYIRKLLEQDNAAKFGTKNEILHICLISLYHAVEAMV